MKKTLALLIAVLMIVAMLPLSILTVAAEEPAQNLFEVYDALGAKKGAYATLAAADAALEEGGTLKLLANYVADTAYVWGTTHITPINFTIDGNNHTITYEGADALWTFGLMCTGATARLKNIGLAAVGGGEAVVVCEGATVLIESGYYASNGPAVARTMEGVSADPAASLIVAGGQFELTASETVNASYAVITNGDGGNVYIYAGMFMNNNDTVSGAACSEYVMKHTDAAGDFKIYGGVMMATGVQKGFYKPADTSAAEGVSLPGSELPIIKGVTSSYNMDGREFYYTTYGAAEGDSLLVPTISSAALPVVGEDGNALAFVTNVSADLAAAITTWARSKAYAAGVDADAYVVKYATLITSEDAFMSAGASPYMLDGDEFFFVYADENNTTTNADGSFEYVAVTPEITTDLKEMRVVAINVIELYIDTDVLTDGVQDDSADIFCGEFDMTSGLPSMATAVARALRDNAAEATGVYKYPSITVAQAFNRYTELEQQILMEYLAHEHDFDFNGDCTDEDCDATVCAPLLENVPAFSYSENGSKQVFKIELEEDIRYAIGLEGTASYQLYDEDGNVCAVENGIVAPAATGTYYLEVNGEKTGSYTVIFSHVHHVDYLGNCQVCSANVAIAATVGAKNNWVGVKGNTYVLTVALEAGVSYTMRATNGTFVLYNAAGEAQTVVNNTFTCPEEGAGTYYVVVEANYTGTLALNVEHIHQHDYTGLCTYCGEKLGVKLDNVYMDSVSQRVKAGEKIFISIRLEAEKTYKILANGYIGSYTIYNADGVVQTLNNASTFVCPADGIYYLQVNVQTDTTAQLRFEVEHGATCTYNNKGECAFTHTSYNGTQVTVSCGRTVRSNVKDGETSMFSSIAAGSKVYLCVDYAAKGATYNFTITGAVNYTFYKADGTALTGYTVATEGDADIVTYVASADTVIYLVLENAGETAVAASVALAHEHVIDHRGQCTVKNTTTGSTPAACAERQSTNLATGTAINVAYTANGLYRYVVSMMSDVEYKIVLSGAEATWVLLDADGDTVYSSANATAPFIPTISSTYYLQVNATADATEGATLKVEAHIHSFNNKGECVGEDCAETYRKKVLEADVTYYSYLGTGDYFFHVNMEAGEVYKLSFTAEGVTYKLYSGANADVEETLTNGAFACTVSGTYYYVVTVSEDIPANQSYIVEIVVE